MEAQRKYILEDTPDLILELKDDIARLEQMLRPQAAPATNRIMRHREAAEFLGLSESRLYQTTAPFHKQGGTRFYLESELRDWLIGK
jgi:predicted DNA-binding transcriptional regulator AlpA